MTIGKAKQTDETTNEQVITGATRSTYVEDALTREQKTRELVSCGRLRRDAPGADDEEIASTDSIIDDLLRQVKEEGKAELGASEFVYGHGDENQAESSSRRQARTVQQSVDSFCDEFAGRIRAALVKAMEEEEIKNSSTSFTTLSDWDFSAPCARAGCDGKVRSNVLFRKGGKTRRCFCGEVQENLHLYDKMEDNSNLFHTVSEQVAESILKEVCKTRYKGNSGFIATMEGNSYELFLEDGGVKSKLSGRAANQRFTTNSAKSLGTAIECVITANDYIEKLGLNLNKIGIETENGLTLADISAQESEEESNGVFYALASRVRDEIKHRVRSLRIDDPEMKDTEGRRINGKEPVDDWAEKISTHILYAIQKHDGFVYTESASFSGLANPGQNNSILKLSHEATEFVDRLVEENDGLLTDFFSTETIPPMICQPRDWVLDEERLAVGGYLTSAMKERMPMIPREKTHIRLGMSRISITQAALDTINMAQRTQFRVDERMLELQLESLVTMIRDYSGECLEGRLTGGKLLISIREGSEDKLSRLPDPHSLEMWMRQAMCARSILENDDIDGRFYHPLRIDHRGRMYTSSSWLDPQGDDFSRGLIRLGGERSLNDEGWKWLRISVAKIWEGLGEGPGKLSSFEELLRHTESPDSPFVRMLVEIADDPIGTIDLWSDNRGDIVRAHSEGFQRLSATLAFVDALNEGGEGAKTDYVTRQDASSNIYQHISLLLRDQEMAQLVNVLESDRPADIYQKVADGIKNESSKAGSRAIEALSKIDSISLEASQEILSGIATRKHSKSPVMTKGYGSGRRALEDMLLSHNGKPGRKSSRRKASAGKFGWINTREGEEEEYVQEFETIARQAGSRIGEISESLSKILNTTSVNSTRQDPNRGVFYNHGNWRKAAQEAVLSALGSEGNMKEVLTEWKGRVDADSFESLESLLQFINKSVWKRCAHNNSILSGILEGIHSTHQIDERDHEKVAVILAKAFEDSIKEVIPNHKLKSKAKFVKLLDANPVLEWSTGEEGVTVKHISLTPPKSEPIKRRKSEQVEGGEKGSAGMMSSRVYSSERDRLAEERAIAPNFVHSLDAEHMRFVIRRLCEHQKETGSAPQFWLVHDAFGCHPNDMGELRKYALEGLLQIHGKRGSNQNILDEMHGGTFFDAKRKGIGTLEIKQLENVDLNRWYFLN